MLSPTVCRLSLALAIALPAFAGPVSYPSVDSKDAKTPVNIEQAATFAPMSSTWNLSAGYQWRQMGSLNFQTGSQAARSGVPWMAGSGRSSAGGSTTSSFGDPNAAGPSNATANRTYSDGFVNQDGGTPFDGSTGFWGYNNASQVQGNNLSYHSNYGTTSTTAPTTSSFSSEISSLRSGLGWSSDISGSGWFASLESPAIFSHGPIAMSLELGYSYASGGASHQTDGVFQDHQVAGQRTTGNASATTNTTTITDVYDVTGLSVPSAPYAGTFTGPGPLINNIPTSRSTSNSTSTTGVSSGGSRITSISTADFTSNVNESLDVKLNTISFGPHFTWEKERFALGFSTGFALNVADWDSNYNEQLYVRQNGGASRLLKTYRADDSGLKALPGVYAEVNANFRITKHVALFVGGRYDWADTLHGNAGPSSFSFKVSGWTAQGGITVSF